MAHPSFLPSFLPSFFFCLPSPAQEEEESHPSATEVLW